jgi:predicted nucleotidyltransferase
MVCHLEHHEIPSMKCQQRRRYLLPEPSFNFAEVRWPRDKEQVISAVKSFAHQLMETGDVREVWLFGSYVTDQYMYGSDVDLCIVMNENSKLDYETLLEIFQNMNTRLEVQFQIYSSSQFDNSIKEGDLFIKSIIKNGIKIQ